MVVTYSTTNEYESTIIGIDFLTIVREGTERNHCFNIVKMDVMGWGSLLLAVYEFPPVLVVIVINGLL